MSSSVNAVMEGGRVRVARRRRLELEEHGVAPSRTGSDGLRPLASAMGNRAFSQVARAQLQRKIGFEIETALPASRAVEGEDEVLSVREVRQELRHQLVADAHSKSGNRERVWPKERMYEGPGWYATADNTDRLGEGSQANVELVTDPPLPTGRDEAAELEAAVKHLKTMQDWADGLAATASARRNPVGGKYAIGFPSAKQVKRLGEEDPRPEFRPSPALGGATAETAWTNSGACTLTLTKDQDTITISHGPKKPPSVNGVRQAKKKKSALNIKQCMLSLGDAGYGEAMDWIKAAVSAVSKPAPPPALPEYDRGLPNTDGYVQVNVGVGLGQVGAVRRYEALGNPLRSAETAAEKHIPDVVGRLEPLLPGVPQLDLEGLATLLSRAVIGGREYPVKGLIKNMWGTLTKSELHSWWKLHLTAIGYDIGEKYLKSIPSLVTAFAEGLGVPKGDRLMLQYDAKDIAEVPQIANLANLTVGQYLTEVLSFTADKLTAGALAHRETTGGGESSVIAAHGVGDDTGEQNALPVGVLELRNITTYWKGGTWAEEGRLRAYAHIAYVSARKPD
jgi:hypothetical protein